MSKARKQKKALHEGRAWASKYITRLKRFAKLHPDLTRVILYVRVSDPKQYRAKSQESQRARLLRAAKNHSLEVVEIIIDVKPAKRHSKRKALRRAFELARENDAFVLAYAMNRFVRSEKHHSTERPDAVPTKAEFEEVAALANGVSMVTVLAPNMPEFEVRSRMTKLAKKYRGNPGGRPRKEEAKSKTRQATDTKARYEFYFDRCLELHDDGMSYRAIEAEAATWESPFKSPPYRTIAGWIERHKRRCASFSKRRPKS